MATIETAPKPVSEQLDEQLTELEAQLPESSAAPLTETGDTPTATDRAVAPDKPIEAAPNSKKPSDTPSEADKAEVETAQAEAAKEGKELKLDDKGVPSRDAQGKFVKQDKKPAPETAITFTPQETEKFSKWLKQTQSKYTHDLAKKLVRWDTIQEKEKGLTARIASEDARLKGAIAKFNADVQQFQASKTVTPEQHDAWAVKEGQRATALEAESKTAEDAGDFDKAEKLKAQAVEARAFEKIAKGRAEELRKNPPPTIKQQQEQFETNQKSWVDKACIDFPAFKDKESSVFKGAVEYFKQITASDPVVAKLPGFIYFAVERAALKTAADRVPALEKETGELKTKLTELEALTNPTPSGGVARQPAKKGNTLDDEFEALQAEAAHMTVP
jgi:hypothetical protein